MSNEILIRRMYPVINGYVQLPPNLEASKTSTPVTSDETFESIPEVVRLDHNPLHSNSSEVDQWQTVPRFDDNF